MWLLAMVQLGSAFHALGAFERREYSLDEELGFTEDPRGITLDEDDGLRDLQSNGIYDKIHTGIGQCMVNLNFIGGVRNDLS
ncbi:hypothetical protein FKW77_004123 [Venturia effusa]|uniref:Uncharacterized protein n=1 Tax=Venturia effusa TaxID=50376 RepID=A0A517LLG6_9PEZI|nr:hypothetical protein FKW77_004123 [Venturia effusa]